jgi:hypothetical protein
MSCYTQLYFVTTYQCVQHDRTTTSHSFQIIPKAYDKPLISTSKPCVTPLAIAKCRIPNQYWGYFFQITYVSGAEGKCVITLIRLVSVNSKAWAFGISIVIREQQRDLPRKDTFYRMPNTRG